MHRVPYATLVKYNEPYDTITYEFGRKEVKSGPEPDDYEDVHQFELVHDKQYNTITITDMEYTHQRISMDTSQATDLLELLNEVLNVYQCDAERDDV